MTKTVLAMTSVKPGGNTALNEYLGVVGPLMERAGATLISRYEVTETLSGTEPPHFVSIIAYPSDEAVAMVFKSPAYIALKPVREKAFARYDVCVLI